MNHRFLWICAKSGIAGSYGNSIFSFSWSFPNVLHSDCVNLHSHRECNSVPFFPHSIICCVQIWGWWPFWLVWGDTSLYISFAFFWYLVMLSIFPYAFWSSVCLLWRNVCLYTLPTFLWDCLFDTEVHELFIYFGDYCAVVCFVCKYFLSFCELSFCLWFLLVYGSFWLQLKVTCLFFFLFSLLQEVDQKPFY